MGSLHKHYLICSLSQRRRFLHCFQERGFKIPYVQVTNGLFVINKRKG